ncbi:MAG: helix-turn-helix domain-containing protein [Caldilineaceae bacterium]
MSDDVSFAQWLRQRRRQFDLTQAELAEKSHYALSTIRKLETDELIPSQELAERLAEVLAVPPAERAEFVKFARGRTNPVATPRVVEPSGSAPLASNQEAQKNQHAPSPAQPRSVRLSNVPVPLTQLVGREQEVAQIVERLHQPMTRLLTLTGAPGSGKTRLSITVAQLLRSDFQDGVHFTSLAPISDPALVLSTVAHGLGLHEAGAPEQADFGPLAADEPPPLRQLSHFLHDKEILLVLDNFEQVTEASETLVQLLQAAPDIKILVTSREPLRVYGESEFWVAPLTLPPTKGATLTDLQNNPAVRLFVERARAVQHSFVLTTDNLRTVVQICTRLDGLPLALEMAAAQMKWLALPAIWTQLSSLPLNLRRTWRDANPRQATLRSAIEWSYQLLTRDEQQLFNLFGLFVGGGSVEALHAVRSSAPGNETIEETETQLQSLVEHSLLQVQFNDDGVARYRMLETIRDYAFEQLEAQGDVGAALQRQIHYYLDLAQRSLAELSGAQGKVWLERLQAEHNNYRALLQRFIEKRGVDSESGLRLVAALSRFWHRAGHWHEGRRWFELALAQDGPAPAELRAVVLRHLASFLVNQGEQKKALHYAEESLTLLRQDNDPSKVADVLYVLGFICLRLRAYARAQSYLEASASLLDAKTQRVTLQNVLDTLGYLMLAQGDDRQGQHYYTQFLVLARQAGDNNAIANALNGLGELARWRREYASAIRYFEESIEYANRSGSQGAQVSKVPNCAFAYLQQGNLPQATRLFSEGLRLSQETGDKVVLMQCLAGVAGMAIKRAQYHQAAQLSSATQQLLQAASLHLDVTDQRDFEESVAVLRTKLESEAMATAWALGWAMSLEEAVGLARRILHD